MSVAYSYIRFSTPEQSKGDSLRRQTEASEQYAAQHGLTLDTTLNLHDLGLSAFDRTNVKKGALAGFLEAIQRKRIQPGSYLLVESLDRLSRAQVLDALEIFISILRAGVTIVTLADGMTYNVESVGSNFANLLMSITIMARAHEESAIKSKRIRAAWQSKRKNANQRKLTAQCPRWMVLNAEKTAFELIPERTALIREILGMAMQGMGQAQIAKELNKRGVSPFSNHGKGWHSSYIQKIVTSSALYGEMQPHVQENGKLVPYGETVPNYYPALISKDEFFLLQKIRSDRAIGGAKARKGTTIPNLLSGVAKCGYCGKSMILAGASTMRVRIGDTAEAKRLSHKALVCDGARRGLGCFAVQWSYPDFEKSFLTFCRSLDLASILQIVSPGCNESSVEQTLVEKLKSTEAAINDKRRRLDNLILALENGDLGATVVSRIRDYENELPILKDVHRKLQAELESSKLSGELRTRHAQTISELVEQLNHLSGQQLFTARVALAEHIRRVVEVVKVYPAGVLKTPQEMEAIRAELIDDGFSTDRIEEYISSTYRTEPLRQGRGRRGRYASRKDMGRFFTIKAKDGGFRVVIPHFDNPEIVEIELAVSEH